MRVHYVRAGAGDPLVLLHGWPQTWASWSEVIGPLAERFCVIAPDLRGMGATSKPAAGYDTDTVARDVRGLVRALGFEQVLLAGHDWGAAAAYAYAALFREEVRRLAIFDMVLPGFGLMEAAMTPQPRGEFLWHMAFQSVPDIPFALIQGREDAYLRWFFTSVAYDPTAITPEATEAYQAYVTSAAQNAEHRRRPLTIPVSAWGGEASLGELTKECLELAATDVVGGVIPRCGHWVGEERPDFVIAHLLEFFG